MISEGEDEEEQSIGTNDFLDILRKLLYIFVNNLNLNFKFKGYSKVKIIYPVFKPEKINIIDPNR